MRSKADEVASLVQRSHKNEKKIKTKNKNRVAQKKRSGQTSVKAVLEEEVKYGGKICETGMF